MNLRQLKVEKNKDKLRRLALKDGNKICFDCGIRGPLYVVTNFYILVCSTCSFAHRSFQHKVKGISMCEFSDEEVAGVAVGGNDVAAKVWLAHFTGNKPRSGSDHAIHSFVENTFVKELYINRVRREELEEGVQRELHPETRPRAGEAAPALMDPPPAQLREAVSQPAPPAPTSFLIQQQSHVHDLFNARLSTPAPVNTTRSAENPDHLTTSARPAEDLLDSFFSAPQSNQAPSLAQQQHPAAGTVLGLAHNSDSAFSQLFALPGYQESFASNDPYHLAQQQPLPAFVVASHSATSASAAQESPFSAHDGYGEVGVAFATGTTPAPSQSQPQMVGAHAAQQPGCPLQPPVQDSSTGRRQPMLTDSWSSGAPSSFAPLGPQPGRGTGAKIHSDSKVFASLNPFGNK